VRAFRGPVAFTDRAATAQDPSSELRGRADPVRSETAPTGGHGRRRRGGHELTARAGLPVRPSTAARRRAQGSADLLVE